MAELITNVVTIHTGVWDHAEHVVYWTERGARAAANTRGAQPLSTGLCIEPHQRRAAHDTANLVQLHRLEPQALRAHPRQLAAAHVVALREPLQGGGIKPEAERKSAIWRTTHRQLRWLGDRWDGNCELRQIGRS